MVTRRQVRKLMEELGKGRPLDAAAMRAGMTEKTARRYRRSGGMRPRAVRSYRTRADPFEEVWPEVRDLLAETPGLEAQTIFELLRGRPGVSFTDGQLRTFQRGVRRLRALQGPGGHEVMFPQVHRPGEYAQSDFTDMRELGVTIGGEAFPHLCYNFVLPYSNWESGGVVFSETFEALISGFQDAVWKLGKVPKYHRTDNLSAATHELKDEGRGFNERYRRVLSHYGVTPDSNTAGRAHENGDVEQANHRFKRAVEQALLVRGSRDFGSRREYEAFLDMVRRGRNRHREQKLLEELAVMEPLPLYRLEDFRRERPVVRSSATIKVAENTYSVPSRLIGEQVDVRLYSERLEIFFAGTLVQEEERLRGRHGARINYRHVAPSLVRKPGAFARYRWKEALFPTVVFRRAYDALESRLGGRADVEYVRILHLAATTMESEVEAALLHVIEAGEPFDYARVEALASPKEIEVPALEIALPDLLSYDECIVMAGGAA